MSKTRQRAYFRPTYTSKTHTDLTPLLSDIPPADPSNAPFNQNWIVRFSPDSKSLLYSIGSPLPEVKLVNLSDLTNVVSLGNYNFWVRSIEWSSDGSLIALGGSPWVQVVRTSDLKVVQNWQIDDESWVETIFLHWFDNDTKLRWTADNATFVYDFEENLKYSWGAGLGPQREGWITFADDSYLIESHGWIGTVDSDASVRVWPLSA